MLNIFLKIKGYFLLMVFSILLLLPLFSTANAQIVIIRDKENSVSKVLCNGVAILRGTPIKIIASLMVMAVGAGFLLGKIEIKTIIGVCLGVAVIFGAPSLYSGITGNDSGQCTGADPQKI